MNKFEIGKQYRVLHWEDDRREVVTIASRNGRKLTLSDGRQVKALNGMAPDGGAEEVIRLNEPIAGVVRVCHLVL